jgi:hypothetical protein
VGAGLYLILSNSHKKVKQIEVDKKNTFSKSIELVETSPKKEDVIKEEEEEDIEEEKEKLNK